MALALVMLCAALMPVMAPTAAADSATTMNASLPSARTQTSAVWDGTHAYVFGGLGANGVLEEIVRYDPATDTSTTMAAALPSVRTMTSAVWDGTNAYVFGGNRVGGPTNQIVQYHPGTDAVAAMSATLPTARYGTSAVWDGSNAYIFGGIDSSGGDLNQIIRYNPSTNTVTSMEATLPTARHGTSAVWDGTSIYVFGGSAGASMIKEILRYDAATDTVTTLVWQLNTGSWLSAVWDGSNVHLFGSNGPNADVVRFNPAADEIFPMAPLPSRRSATSAIWDGSRAYVFGGSGQGGASLDDIVRYDPSSPPTRPQDLTATAGPGAGQITLNWQAPYHDGGFAIANYRVYRASPDGSEYWPIAEVGDVHEYTDSGLSLGRHSYFVTAINAMGEGYPNEASASAVGPPPLPGQTTQPIMACGSEADPFVLEGGKTYEIRPSAAEGTCFFAYSVTTPGDNLQIDATHHDRLTPVPVAGSNGASSRCDTNFVTGSAAAQGHCRIVGASGTYAIQAHYPANTPSFTILATKW